MFFYKKNLRILAPYVQSGMINSGLMALKSLLIGYKIEITDQQLLAASRGGSRTAPTPLSFDTIVQIGEQLGLEAEQLIMPAEHLLFKDNMPAVVDIRSARDKPPHFVVVWNRVGPFIQIMDPMMGRRWLNEESLLKELYSKPVVMLNQEWRQAAKNWSPVLQKRLLQLGFESEEAVIVINRALADPTWRSLATLDATLRMLSSMMQQGGFRQGAEAKEAFEHLFKKALTESAGAGSVPARHWSVLPESNESETLVFQGGITIVRALRAKTEACSTSSPESKEARHAEGQQAEGRGRLIHSFLNNPLIQHLRTDERLTPYALGLSIIFAAVSIFFQAILFRGLMEVGNLLSSEQQRFQTIVLVFGFAMTLLSLRWPADKILAQMGRTLDARLRLSVLQIMPHLSPAYFQKNSVADITERIHSVRTVDFLPNIGERIIRSFSQILLTVVGIGVIDLASAPFAILRTITVLIVANNLHTLLTSQYIRVRTQNGILSRFYLDIIQGLVAVRTHSAERAVQREYEGNLVQLRQIQLDLHTAELGNWLVNQLLSYGLMALLLLVYALRGGHSANLLLFFYWGFTLDRLALEFMVMIFTYLGQQSKALRFLELLNAPKEPDLAPSSEGEEMSREPVSQAKGIEIEFVAVNVEIAKRTVLCDINLTIEAGSQIAIVGSSGAGKSTLVGLLMGWHFPTTGKILVDGKILSYDVLQTLRTQIAWVDPAIQLWNRSLLDNLHYGTQGARRVGASIIKQADLLGVLERLPKGLQTPLGQEGRFLSGGEGQRVRFGRALGRPDARLVILDEPFRGLDREKRRTLLARARRYWPQATVICVTHDISMTQDFERVLVIENGQIIEDSAPSALMAQPSSRYRALLSTEEAIREKLWRDERWRRLWLEEGQLLENS